MKYSLPSFTEFIEDEPVQVFLTPSFSDPKHVYLVLLGLPSFFFFLSGHLGKRLEETLLEAGDEIGLVLQDALDHLGGPGERRTLGLKRRRNWNPSLEKKINEEIQSEDVILGRKEIKVPKFCFTALPALTGGSSDRGAGGAALGRSPPARKASANGSLGKARTPQALALLHRLMSLVSSTTSTPAAAGSFQGRSCAFQKKKTFQSHRRPALGPHRWAMSGTISTGELKVKEIGNRYSDTNLEIETPLEDAVVAVVGRQPVGAAAPLVQRLEHTADIVHETGNVHALFLPSLPL